jgi:Protein of unknown function (DUF3108)
MKKFILLLFLAFSSIQLSAGTDFCGVVNTAFTGGEHISFKIYYSVIGIFVDAGDASFTVTQTRLYNKPVYNILGIGNSNPRYDWIFKVRDRYESFIDTASLIPYKFIRNVDEGGYKKYELVNFDQVKNEAVSQHGTFKVPPCIQDVLSSIYYARNIDFNKYKTGDKIPFNMFLDDEVYSLYIRYMGKEIIKTRYGKFRAIKFKPMLIKGTIFEGGEKMTVWVSDDPNHIPLRIESPITVGSVKVDMMSYKNLRYPISSMVSVR